MGSRNFAELLPGRADQWRLSSFRQALFFTSAVLYIFALFYAIIKGGNICKTWQRNLII